jgi:hypothetical protein
MPGFRLAFAIRCASKRQCVATPSPSLNAARVASFGASFGTANADQPELVVGFMIRDRLREQRDDMAKEGQR